MSNESKNIDKLVKSALADFIETPPADAWANIADGLKSKKRVLFPLIFKWAASIAIILFTAGLYYYIQTENKEKLEFSERVDEFNGIDVRNEINQESGNTLSLNSDTNSAGKFINSNLNNYTEKKEADNFTNASTKNIATTKSKKVISATSNIASVVNNKINKDKDLVDEFAKSAINQNKADALLVNESIKNNESIVLTKDDKETSLVITGNDSKIDKLMADNKFNKKDDKANEFPVNSKIKESWSIGAVASPLYSYRNLTRQTDDVSFKWGGGESNTANEQAIIAYAGGLDVEYSLDRWSFSSGVYFSRMGQQTSNFYINRIINSGTESVIYAATSLNTIQIKQSNAGTHSVVGGQDDAVYLPDISSNDPIETTAVLTQEFEFIELPLIARYDLIDSKIDVQIVSGFSTGYLLRSINNLNYLGQDLDLGSSGNIYKLNYNTLMGFALQLPIGSKLRFKIEPQFKYALNSLNMNYSISYHPYSFAMYTGLMYEF